MNTPTSFVRYRVILAAVVLLFVAAACVPHRDGVSWADMTLVGEENNILVSYNGFIVLVDPVNGAPVPLRDADGNIRMDSEGIPRRWEISGKDTKSQFFASPVWLDDNTLLVLDYNRRLLVINVLEACLANRSGACVDNYTQVALPGRSMADMVQYEDMVFIAMSDNDLVAVDLNTLEQVWLFETRRGVWSAPVVVDGVVYVTSMGHLMYAIDARTGREIWSLDLGGALASSPLYYDGGESGTPRFYVGSFDRKVFEVSLDGRVLSEHSVENWIWSTPVLYENILYVSDIGGYVHALDVDNGMAEIWKTAVDQDGIRPSPLIADNYVIVASKNGNLYWLDRTSGMVLFNREVQAEILSELLLVERADETLVVVSTTESKKTLVAFTLEGLPRWTYER